jgi:large subunit ribosomal protein L17
MGQRKLNKSTQHRIAMLRNQSSSLFQHGAIVTTLPKCKELRKFVEPLITLAKEDTIAHRRQARRHIQDPAVLHYLFEEIGPRYAARPGGYTRITRLPDRERDSAPIAKLELVTD